MKNNLKFNLFIKWSLLIFDALLISWLMQFVLLGKPCFMLSATAFIALIILNARLRKVANILGILFALIYPISKTLQDGLLQWASIEVLLTTNINEAVGFQQTLPYYLYIQAICFISLFLLNIIFNKKLQINLLNIHRPIFILFVLIIPVTFYNAYKTLSPRIKDMICAYNELVTPPILEEPQWKIAKKGKHYKKYIVIIGESMRRDLMSVYGFPLKTTPFLDNVPKQMITNFISPAPYTIVSVPRFLSIVNHNGQFEAQNNAVSLAKIAGFKTYWISSQGYTGQWNLGPRIIANYADEQHFSAYGSDDLLLPKIQETINKKEDQVIFIHIIGSHENPCHRLGNYPNKYKTDEGGGGILTCYLSTYNRTDDFIAKIVEKLKIKIGDNWSLMYFSDHGLNFQYNNNKFSFMRDPNIKQSYQVPFIIISGDNHQNSIYNVTRSGNNLINFFPTWFGVITNLTPAEYNIFTASDDNPQVMSYDEKFMDYSKLHESVTADDILNKVHPKKTNP